MKARHTKLARMLKNARQGRGLTLREVERMSRNRISNAYLSQIETGKVREPSLRLLKILCTCYDISYYEVFQATGYPMPVKELRYGHV